MRPILGLLRQGSQLLHRLAHMALGLCVVFSVIVAFGAWRLAQGPVDVSWLSDRARETLLEDNGPVRLSFGHAALAWGGVGDQLEHLLELRISDVTVRRRNGSVLAVAPQAWMAFSIPALLAGRFVPRAVEIDRAQISVPGDALSGTGAESDHPDPLLLVRRIAEQVNGGRGDVLERLRRVHIRDAALEIPQPGAGSPIVVSAIDLDLVRHGSRHLRASVAAVMSVARHSSRLTVSVDLLRGADSRATLSLASFLPSTLGSTVAGAAGINVPLSLDASLVVDPRFDLRSAQISMTLESGTIQLAQGHVPVRRGSIEVSGTRDGIDITRAVLDVAPTAADPPALLRISGTVRHKAQRLTAAATIGLDNVNLAELPQIWPEGIGGGARPWVTEHVLSGTATHGTASIALEAGQDLRDVVMTQASGTLDGTGVAFTWLDSMPPIEQAEVHLHLLDPDSLDVLVPSGRQKTGTGDTDLQIENGVLHITGLSLRDQIAAIRLQARGPVTSTLALLKQPRLHLLSEHPINFTVDAGTAAVTLDFQFPLDNRLQMDDVAIHAGAHLTDVRLPRVVGTNTFDQGVLDLDVTKDGLRAEGQGALAAIPVKLQGMMDFTAGPPNQTVQKVVVSGQPTASALRAAGVDLTDIVNGAVPLTVTLLDRRVGGESVTINGDLTEAGLTVAPLGWTKPSGSSAAVNGALSLSHGRLTGLERFSVSGPQLTVTGSARAVDGRIGSVSLDEVRLGETHGRGTVRITPGEPLAITLSGDAIDLSPRLTATSPKAGPNEAPPVTTPRWVLDARFTNVILANGVRASNTLVRGSGNGEAVQALDVVGTLQGGAGVSLQIQPHGDRRHLRAEAGDAGLLLRGLDVARFIQSGHLVIDGELAGLDRYHPLAGSAVIQNARVMKSAGLGKLLEAITIYGLADVVRGPGMTFSRIDIPFQYDGGGVRIQNARAFNSSLGLTAQGRIETRAERIDLDGTIVPAYFFNAMLGDLPLVGKLFSPEKGGGVFAIGFALRGDLDDPRVSVNPVTALTPGFLRNMFGKADRDVPAADARQNQSTPQRR